MSEKWKPGVIVPGFSFFDSALGNSIDSVRQILIYQQKFILAKKAAFATDNERRRL